MSYHNLLLPLPSAEESDETREPEDVIKKDVDNHSRRSNFASTRLALSIQLYIAILATVILALQLLRALQFNKCPGSPSGVEPSTQYLGINPGGEYVEYTYSRDLRYMSLDHKYDDLWEWGNIPSMNISEPKLDKGGNVEAVVSMFHQLHCLESFRIALQGAYEGQQVAFDWHENGHWPHCLDYLRNTILCFADGTIELPRIVNGSRTEIIDGAQDMRRCRSNKALMDLRNTAENS